jgi:para-nitrobenzyl esterase
MKRYVSIVGAAALLGTAIMGLAGIPAVAAENPVAVTAPASLNLLALANISAKTDAKLTVKSPAFAADGDIPFENTQYRGNIFPGLSWSHGPAGTKSYAIIMQDPDSLFHGAAILHWTMFNIPASVTSLDAGMSAPPEGSAYGPNIRGPNHAYMGPHTPPGPKHHYHLQVFALDTALAPESAGDYDGLTAAMKGHVLAVGELVGLGQADPTAPPRAPAPAPTPAPAAH